MALQQSIPAVLLLAVSMCQAQTGRLSDTSSSERRMEPWLVGMAAMVGFLFIVFTILIIKRLLKKDRDEGRNLYDNSLQMESEEGPGLKQTNL